jgi:excisionase family DNA binding protein
MEILTIGDLAKELQVSESTVHRMMRGGLPHFKVGWLVRFKKDRVEKYLDRMSSERHRLIRRTKGGCP